MLFGVSRQSYYQRGDSYFERSVLLDFVLEYISELRGDAPRLGCEKLYEMCRSRFKEKLPMGRDSFYNFLRERGLMLRVRKRRARTTFSDPNCRFYPNLIKDLKVTSANQVWVSDITYVCHRKGFSYLFLLTDLYSHKILGWVLSDSLRKENACEALKQAIGTVGSVPKNLIHHSDRGSQYTSIDYMDILEKEHILVSRTERGDPKENAVAERVNGILKQEWLSLHTFENESEIRAVLAPAIEFYNTRRPHASNDMLTPDQAYERKGVLRRRWKNYYPSARKIDSVTT